MVIIIYVFYLLCLKCYYIPEKLIRKFYDRKQKKEKTYYLI